MCFNFDVTSSNINAQTYLSAYYTYQPAEVSCQSHHVQRVIFFCFSQHLKKLASQRFHIFIYKGNLSILSIYTCVGK